MFTKVTEYSHYLGGEPVDITDRLLPQPQKVWSQMPPETVSEVENLIFLGKHARLSLIWMGLELIHLCRI